MQLDQLIEIARRHRFGRFFDALGAIVPIDAGHDFP